MYNLYNVVTDQYQSIRKAVTDRTIKWYTFVTPYEGRVLQVPYDAFMHWALMFMPEQPPYETDTPIGVKIDHDYPCHTDWLFGCNIEEPWLHYMGLTELGYLERSIIHRRIYDTSMTILSRGGLDVVHGVVVHPEKGASCMPHEIAIIPNAGPDYVQAAHSSAAVITEVGGCFAHLVQVSEGCVIVQAEGTLAKFKVGEQLVLDLTTRIIRLADPEEVVESECIEAPPFAALRGDY